MSNFLYQLSLWFLIFIIYSFIGWVFELACTIVYKHRLYNRGFLIGPICPIYGFGALLITALLSNTDSIIAIFCVSLVGSGTLEYLTSLIMERLFHVRWWDYSEQPFNLNGRICLFTLLAFGVLGVFVIKLANPFFLSVLTNWPAPVVMFSALFVFLLLITDLIISLRLILHFRVAASTTNIDATEEITKNIRALFSEHGKLSRRLVRAFPELKVKAVKTKPKTSRKIAKNKK